MKIGIITFHWATNYGAVLQAYALQTHLIKQGYNVEIINYIPKNYRPNFFRLVFKKSLHRIINGANKYCQEKKIEKFRKTYLRRSKKTYANNLSLQQGLEYNCCICGSDQIWNQSFTLKGEKKPTLSYFLNFVSSDKERISYAASFGCDIIPQEMEQIIYPELVQFNAVSVREESGVSILDRMNIKAQLVLDPIMLLRGEDYRNLCADCSINKQNYVFPYILHEGQNIIKDVIEYINQKGTFNVLKSSKYTVLKIEEWLKYICCASLVITNSFHGIVFSILFHVPFIVLPVEGSSMNGRITTLLRLTSLENRMLEKMDRKKIDDLMCQKINWDIVDEKLEIQREKSRAFLDNALIKGK